MESNWKILAGGAATVILSLAIGVSAGSALAEPSDSKLTIAPPLISVQVEPVAAPAGVPRKIVVNGIWPNGCVPTHALLGFPPSWARDQALGVLLAEPLTLQACTAALTPYRFELDYTPMSPGQREIVVMTTLAAPLGNGRLVTGDFASGRARHDVSGAWYDPQVPGSGLMIAHDDGRSDAIFATWQTYHTVSGLPYWYSLQQGHWDTSGLVLEATLYETTAAPGIACDFCPLPAQSTAPRGRVRLTFSVNGANGGLDAALDLVPATGAVQRLANLRRFLPDTILVF